MNYSKKFLLLSSFSIFLVTLYNSTLQSMIERDAAITLNVQDLQCLAETSSLFLPILKGETDLVETILQDSAITNKINFVVMGGSCNGYSALRLAVDLWSKKIVSKRSDQKKQAYKDIAQILINKGAKFTGDMEETLRKMGVKLPERTGASYWQHARRMGQEIDDLSKLDDSSR